MKEEFEGLVLVELLDLLEPIPEPAPVPWTPQTPGWIFVAVVVVALAYTGIRRYVRHRQAEAYRQAAIKELIDAGDDPVRIAEIVRRTALAAFPREDVVGLAGEDWLDFLNRTYPGDDFAGEAGKALLSAPYRPAQSNPALADLAGQWVRNHRRTESAA